MSRTLLTALLGFALAAAAGLPPSAAQDQKKKEKAKGPPRIAIHDPAKVSDDPDFADQGEYEGDWKGEKVGAQVVALGGGQFTVQFYAGGLPGAGWDGKGATTATGKRDGKGVVVTAADSKDAWLIAGGVVTRQSDSTAAAGSLKKVERKSPTLGARPPEGAAVLFAGPGDESNWTKGKLAELSDGKFLTVDRAGDLRSKQAFGAFKAHIEFRLPWMPNSRGQGRGNSGVYAQDRYEIQVLDSFGLKGENNECGGVYTQHKPKVNMCLPPLAWQTYDIVFTPAEFDGDKRTKPARLTLAHNGVLIHDDVELKGPTGGGASEKPTPGPFRLQDHGDPVVYRNIWVMEKK